MEEVEKKLGVKRFVGSVWWMIKMYWGIGRSMLTIYLGSTVLDALNPMVASYVTAKAIDRVVKISQSSNPVFSDLYVVGLWYLSLTLFFGLVGRSLNYSRSRIYDITDRRVRKILFLKLRELGVQSLEQPKVNNMIARASRNIHMLSRQLEMLVGAFGALVGVVVAGGVLVGFMPLFVLIFVLASIPRIISDRYFSSLFWREERRTTERRRKAGDSIFTLIDTKSLHELNITGGYRHLVRLYDEFTEYWLEFLAKNRRRWMIANYIVGLLRVGTRIVGFLYIFWQFVLGKMTIGTVTFYVRAVQQLGGNINMLANRVSNLYESSQKIDELRQVFEMEPAFEDGAKRLKKMKKGPGIVLRDVSFTYPGSKKKVIKNLNLNIKPGEKVAIVGHNGAGKTTLVKLLCRFYQVSEGELVVNETNINDVKIDSWYRNLGVLFQEYNMYRHLTAWDNIVIGDVKKKGRRADVLQASKRADAHGFIKELERGYEQVLSEKFKGGVRPSTGQWQKIAIARFFYRDAPLVIFDEPTAAIDAVSEKRIFDKIYKFFEKKTVVIISHRFSTVRNADRIIVFEKGQVVEHGSHRELMAMNKVYAKAFKLQAEGYN